MVSLVGRQVLLQSVCSKVPNYWLNYQHLPSKVQSTIQSLCTNLLWSGQNNTAKHLTLITWASIAQPTIVGGLSLRNFSTQSTAFLAHTAQRLLSYPNAYWARNRILIHKYPRNMTFANCTPKLSDSRIWKSILRCCHIILNKLTWVVGDVTRISIFSKQWIPWS